jgi:hypothetical protein
MRSILKTALLCSIVWSGTAATAQKVVLKMKRHDGATATYKHLFTTRFKSDRADLLTSRNSQVGGADSNIRNDDVSLEVTGEWNTRETWGPKQDTSEGTGEWRIAAKLIEADSRASVNGKKLGFEKYPFGFEQLRNREMSFEMHSTQGPSLIRPEFRVYQLREREDIVTDMSLAWASGIAPSFPDHAIGEGDTWEAEQKLTFPFYALEATGREAEIVVKSTYTVKKLKKGGKVFEIEEERKIAYLGWTETSNLSVMVEGSGKGNATWEFDVEKGIVNKCRYQQFLDRPSISIYGKNKVLEEVRAEYSMVYQMKLDKFKK